MPEDWDCTCDANGNKVMKKGTDDELVPRKNGDIVEIEPDFVDISEVSKEFKVDDINEMKPPILVEDEEDPDSEWSF